MIEQVVHQGSVYAMIIRHDYRQSGVRFFTPGDYSQQLGYMSHPAGHRIEPHVHLETPRSVHRTQEVLVIRKGRIRVIFYDAHRRPVDSRILGAGDVILLVDGGHGFDVLEDCEMIEVKQGPYLGDDDKVRFVPDVSEGEGQA